jgi:uncharacterized protein (DUF3084 family)
VTKKKLGRRKSTMTNEGAITPRDPLLPYKKPQLVERLHTTQQQLYQTQQQLAVQAEKSVKREARIAELETRLATLEPYRSFVEQICAQIQREERGRSGDLPSDL